LEGGNKFEVVVIDEAAQSVEPSTLAGLQLGSSHAILVGGESFIFHKSLFYNLHSTHSFYVVCINIVTQKIPNSYQRRSSMSQGETPNTIAVFSNAWKRLDMMSTYSIRSIECIQRYPNFRVGCFTMEN